LKSFFNKFIADHIIVETENLNTENRQNRAISESASYRLACPGLSECTALRDCPQILAEATTRCYNSDRSLFCGVNQNFEPYVCCPSYPSYSTPTYAGESSNNLNNPADKLSGLCGKSLIQGSTYKKLGAFPFVARIGFKSKFLEKPMIIFSKSGHNNLTFTLFLYSTR
jgi:hypothetical protein